MNLFEEKQKILADKILDNKRISEVETLYLYEDFSLAQLSYLATARKKTASGKNVFFNRNIHVEPTNICIYNCRFCSYKAKSLNDGYVLSASDIIEKLKPLKDQISEVHITGGVHPEWGVNFFASLLSEIRSSFPEIHIKAFTAVEIEYMCQLDDVSIEKGLKKLINSGLQSLPGGGAEIFDEEIREKISPEKSSGNRWLEIHKIAHKLGLKTNATILYGHVENIEQRIKHMSLLRELQDDTKGFQAFIPLKFRSANNQMSDVQEVSLIEDMRNYALSRIFLDNFPHLKAYWPAIGKDAAQMSLLFGVDDLDGTINDSTSIYSRAGAETSPQMSFQEMTHLINDADYISVERDSLYNSLSNG